MSKKVFFEYIAGILSTIAMNRFILILVIALMSAMILGWFAATNTFDHDLKDMMSGQNEAFRRYQDSLDLFGPDDDIIAAFPMDELNENSMRDALNVREAIQSIAGIESIFDLAMAAGIDNQEKMKWIAERSRLLTRQIDGIRKSNILRDYLVGHQEKAQAVVIRTHQLGAQEKHKLVRTLRTTLNDKFGKGWARLGGYPVFAERYVFYMMHENAVFFALSITLALFVSILMFRSFWLTISVSLAVVFPVIWTHGLFALMGYKISLFSTLLSPIILFVALSLSVQFIARFKIVLERSRLKNETEHDRILKETLEESLPPSLMCTLTALVGFSSQIFSTLSGVRAFGIFSTLGSLLAFVSVIMILPGMISRFWSKVVGDQPTGSSVRFERRIGRGLARLLLPPAIVYIGAIFITAGIGWGISYLRVGSDPLDALPPDDVGVSDYKFIESNFFLGARQISLVLRPKNSTFDFFQPYACMENLKEKLASDPEIVTILSPTTILLDTLGKLSGSAGKKLKSDSDVNQALRLAYNNAPQLLSAFINHPYCDRARMVIGLRVADAPRVTRAAERIEAIACKVAKDELIASATGRMLLSALIESEALGMEIQSFSTALIGILLIIGIGFGSFRMLFVGFVANFLPLVMALGTMGWLGRSLDPVTGMVPCLCLGIIVDDTIHIFHEMESEEAKGHGPTRSRAVLMFKIGWAIISASLIPILGLGILCLSNFGPIRSFGGYAVLAMFYGIFFDLFLTPALLALTRKNARKSKKET